MAQEKNQIFSNGWGTRILSTFLGLLLFGAVGSGLLIYKQMGQVLTEVRTINERLDRMDYRIQRLERDKWESRNGP